MKKRAISKIAPTWWDYTTLDSEILTRAAKLTLSDLKKLERKGFSVAIYDNIQEFYVAEALEYIGAWKEATASRPAGICGPIGPTEQLPIVAQIVNATGMNLKNCHFWGMDEWAIGDKSVPRDFPMGFEKTDMEMCFDRIRNELRMPKENLHFPSGDINEYSKSFDEARCVIMQGGQGETKHWAFNDPVKREGQYIDNPPTPEEYLKKSTRFVDLHPITLMQNARTSGGGAVQDIPTRAISVGPAETWKCEQVSIWNPGHHDNPFGMRLTAYMVANKIADSSVPMSLLGLHDNVKFNYLKSGFGNCAVDMH